MWSRSLIYCKKKTVLAHEDVIQDGVTIIKIRENFGELQ
jgi:hypoxanthine-guanine phosphoribosyltransferase